MKDILNKFFIHVKKHSIPLKSLLLQSICSWLDPSQWFPVPVEWELLHILVLLRWHLLWFIAQWPQLDQSLVTPWTIHHRGKKIIRANIKDVWLNRESVPKNERKQDTSFSNSFHLLDCWKLNEKMKQKKKMFTNNRVFLHSIEYKLFAKNLKFNH